jgi:hypothetical protein
MAEDQNPTQMEGEWFSRATGELHLHLAFLKIHFTIDL